MIVFVLALAGGVFVTGFEQQYYYEHPESAAVLLDEIAIDDKRLEPYRVGDVLILVRLPPIGRQSQDNLKLVLWGPPGSRDIEIHRVSLSGAQLYEELVLDEVVTIASGLLPSDVSTTSIELFRIPEEVDAPSLELVIDVKDGSTSSTIRFLLVRKTHISWYPPSV